MKMNVIQNPFGRFARAIKRHEENIRLLTSVINEQDSRIKSLEDEIAKLRDIIQRNIKTIE